MLTTGQWSNGSADLLPYHIVSLVLACFHLLINTKHKVQLSVRLPLAVSLLYSHQWCQLFSFAISLRSISWILCFMKLSISLLQQLPVLFFPLQRQARVWGEVLKELLACLFEIMFILRLWWNTIIYVPWAIFPCWPTREHSVFDMPVVLEKKEWMACVWVLFSI